MDSPTDRPEAVRRHAIANCLAASYARLALIRRRLDRGELDPARLRADLATVEDGLRRLADLLNQPANEHPRAP